MFVATTDVNLKLFFDAILAVDYLRICNENTFEEAKITYGLSSLVRVTQYPKIS